MVFLDLRIHEFAAVRLEVVKRAFLIRAHQPRVTGDIGGEDGGKAADRGHFAPSGRMFS